MNEQNAGNAAEPRPPLRGTSRRLWSLGFRILVSVGVLGWLLWRTEWEPILTAVRHVRLEYCALSLAIYCLAQVVSSYRWQILARSLGFAEKLRRYIALYYIGMFFNLFLPTSMGGDVVRTWYLGAKHGRRWLAAMSVLSERLAGLMALLFIACIATFANLDDLPAWSLWTVWGAAAAAVLGLAALPQLGRWSAKCRSLSEGLSLYGSQHRRWAGAFGLSLAIQVSSVVQIWLLGLALDLPAPFLAYAVVIPLVNLLTMLPFSVNGVGVREGSLVLLLAPVGVSQAGAVALGLVWFCVLAAASMLGGAVYLLGRYLGRIGDTPMDLSVVIPIKDERQNLRPLHEQLREAVDPLALSYELIFVDDGSTDGSFQVLEELAAADPTVKVVQLRRNYGQTPALQAGIDCSQGDVIVTMDGDLQNDPQDIPVLLDHLREGYDVVLGWRKDRQDGLWHRKLPSWMANALIRWVTRVHIRDMGCTLRAMTRQAAAELPLYGEMHRFIPVLAQNCGNRILQIPVRHHPRRFGQTKYNISRSVRVLLDLITVKFLHSYLTRPMHLFGLSGLLCMFGGLLSLLVTLGQKLVHSEDMTGNPLLLLSVMLTVVGVQFISMGLIGEVLARTYFESQGKTAYTIRTKLNISDSEWDHQRAA